jgi:hypothetical protein
MPNPFPGPSAVSTCVGLERVSPVSNLSASAVGVARSQHDPGQTLHELSVGGDRLVG